MQHGTLKKRFASFPSAAGMPLTAYQILPTSLLGTGKSITFFTEYMYRRRAYEINCSGEERRVYEIKMLWTEERVLEMQHFT
jgi:hypothetical protein